MSRGRSRVSSTARSTLHPGVDGGDPGAAGVYERGSGEPLPLKRVVALAAADAVRLALPGGGGYGAAVLREPELVLADVVEGYVSIEAARDRYRVSVRYRGRPDALVRVPEHYELDMAETARLRARAE